MKWIRNFGDNSTQNWL